MIYKLIMLSENLQIWAIWLSAKNLTFGLHKMPFLKNGFLENIETWHVGLSCQHTHFMSFSSKSEHVTVADQATLIDCKPETCTSVLLCGGWSHISNFEIFTCLYFCTYYEKCEKHKNNAPEKFLVKHFISFLLSKHF